MEPDEKKALDRYIAATDERVAQWSKADREAFIRATSKFPQRVEAAAGAKRWLAQIIVSEKGTDDWRATCIAYVEDEIRERWELRVSGSTPEGVVSQAYQVFNGPLEKWASYGYAEEAAAERCYQAWWWLYHHPIFAHKSVLHGRKPRDGKRSFDRLRERTGIDVTQERVSVDSHFELCFHIEVQKNKQGGIEYWVECGPWLEPEKLDDFQRQYNPEGVPSNDYDLAGGACSFDAAIIELAERVQDKYGDYERRTDEA